MQTSLETELLQAFHALPLAIKEREVKMMKKVARAHSLRKERLAIVVNE